MKKTPLPSQNEVRKEFETFEKKIEDLDSKIDNLVKEALREDEDVIRKLKELLKNERNENK